MTTESIIPIAVIVIFIIFCIPTVKALIWGAPFVPTPMAAAKFMFEKVQLKKGDRFYDIGCGDGRFAYIAARDFGARATGFELSPLIYLLAIIRKYFWQSKAEIIFKDFRKHDLSDADIIFCYLMPHALALTIPKFKKELRPGTRIISYAFKIGDWNPVETFPRNPQLSLATIRIYEIGKEENYFKAETALEK